jgi:hypothetical protein
MATSPQSLSGLAPFLKPYRFTMGVAALFLLLAAGTTLAFPWVLRQLIDQGLAIGATAEQLSGNFLQLFVVAAALAVFSAGRYYTVSWLGERITGDLRNAVYGHVLKQSPAFFETTQSGEVLSRLSSDATLIVHSTAGWPRTSNGLTRPIAFGALARRSDGPRPCPSSPNPPHLQGGHGYAQRRACARALDTAGRSRRRGLDPRGLEQVHLERL